MNDLADAKASFANQAAIFRSRHNWLLCMLYLGTFGSFIGYAAAFPLLVKGLFPDVNRLTYAWVGPLLGAIARPFGGWLADRVGGARVTLWSFVLMGLAVLGVAYFLPKTGVSTFAFPWGPASGSFGGFFVMFLLLFLTSGIGNGSTFRMIPVVFMNLRLRGVRLTDEAAVAHAYREGNTEGAAAVGFVGAIGAYGGFFIPKSYGSSIAATGGPELALYGFLAFYVLCIGLIWWFYARRHAEMPC
jgi:NNP family nitrate/nitrite transporter-like MFS transporter